MVMLYGAGGHLSTQQYSIIVARGDDGVWRGTAVGRSQIWLEDAPFRPMQRAEWTLDAQSGHQLDDAISGFCRRDLKAGKTQPTLAPPLGFILETIVIVTPERGDISYFADKDDPIAALVRPPQQ